MKQIAIAVYILIFSSACIAAEQMATMKYVTGQVCRVDRRIDNLPTYTAVTNIAKEVGGVPPSYEIVTNLAMKSIQPGDKVSSLTNDVCYVDDSITNGLITAIEAKGYADTAENNAITKSKKYTDDEISSINPSSKLKVATGKYLNRIDYSDLYYGYTNESKKVSDCWITNIVLNPVNGYPISLIAHLNGTYSGREFNNTNLVLTSKGDENRAIIEIEDYQGKYAVWYTSQSPSSYSGNSVFGRLTVHRYSPFLNTFMYSQSDNRAYTNIADVVDTSPIGNNNRSLITSKGVYDVVSNKVSKSGDTITGNLSFSGVITTDEWTYPSKYIYGVRAISTGGVTHNIGGNKSVYYSGALIAADNSIEGEFDYPICLKFIKEDSKPNQYVVDTMRFTGDGIYQAFTVITNTTTRKEYSALKIPREHENWKMLGGTIARTEDIEIALEITNTIKEAISDVDSKASNATNEIANIKEYGIKSPENLSLYCGDVSVLQYDGSVSKVIKVGNGLTTTSISNTVTLSVNTNLIATGCEVTEKTKELEKKISEKIDSKTIDRLYSIKTNVNDIITAVYSISNNYLDGKEYKVAVSTSNYQKSGDKLTFYQIDNPSPDGDAIKGWIKLCMEPDSLLCTTNWEIYVAIGITQPTSWNDNNGIYIFNEKTPIFPMTNGESRVTFNDVFTIRKIEQISGPSGNYISGDCNIYSETGHKTDSIAKTSELGAVRDIATNATIKATEASNSAKKASDDVSELNKWKSTADKDIQSLKQNIGKTTSYPIHNTIFLSSPDGECSISGNGNIYTNNTVVCVISNGYPKAYNGTDGQVYVYGGEMKNRKGGMLGAYYYNIDFLDAPILTGESDIEFPQRGIAVAQYVEDGNLKWGLGRHNCMNGIEKPLITLTHIESLTSPGVNINYTDYEISVEASFYPSKHIIKMTKIGDFFK